LKFVYINIYINYYTINVNRIKSGEKVHYDLDFRLDSKYTTHIYPLIIHPLNRFYDLNSYYMTELSEICIQNQGFSDIKISLVSLINKISKWINE